MEILPAIEEHKPLKSQSVSLDYETLPLVPEDTEGEQHKTTFSETFFHLFKGYIGAGCLSLPWAFSQLGIAGGLTGIAVVSLWTSYNCWVLVRLKRYIATQQLPSDATISTYPDIAGWYWGSKFGSFVTACLCLQQISICTVFFSFIGENLEATIDFYFGPVEGFWGSHYGALTIVFPFVLVLSVVPTLKHLVPVTVSGTIFLALAFAALGLVIGQHWHERPQELPEIHYSASAVSLALCAIVYSFEGVCLILPIESAMEKPKQFSGVFVSAMVVDAFILASIGLTCVLTFGEVTNGSVTAFLLKSSVVPSHGLIRQLLVLSNTAISLSVLFTYPLQLYPAVEVVASWIDEISDPVREGGGRSSVPPSPRIGRRSTRSRAASVVSSDDDDNDDDSDDGNSSVSSMLSANPSIPDEILSLVESVQSIVPEMPMDGDSASLRASLVLLTFAVAAAVPNVQTLISLVGAFSGSAVALIIPPLLEFKHILLVGKQKDADGAKAEWGKTFFGLLGSLILITAGLVLAVIGTYASINDIIQLYSK